LKGRKAIDEDEVEFQQAMEDVHFIFANIPEVQQMWGNE